MKAQTAVSRRIVVRRSDVLVINGYSIDASTLIEMLNSDARCLWAFVKNESDDLQVIAYSEDHCIWLQENDLRRGVNDDVTPV